MARSVPTPAKLKQIRLDILRSVYYQQELPSSTFAVGAAWVDAEFTSLLQSKLIAVQNDKYSLTDLGFTAIKKLAGGRVPGMIRMDRTVFMPRKERKKFIVDRSLAKELFREVSADG
ncbi:MAG: hypothetical protein JJ868_17305 [Shimia sp.]|uniref:hypothetical protein n=1 Tax=Shimia sp. TaxID=1954381 RepID=UPI001B1D6A4E|nr:hypothetical protein [Shimia sp.]MBO6899130.1 hypothetical protein [Shimia sp.]